MKPGTIYQMKVTLVGIKPPIWRRVLVPADMRLSDLHEVLQTVMGWYASHLHCFHIGGEEFAPPDPEGFGFAGEFADERKARLRHVLGGVGGRARYTYDFGDDWEHQLVVEKELRPEPGSRYPVCTGGQRACPPEDCGGVPGYYDVLDALKDPERSGEIQELGAEGYDPEWFSVDAVNRELASGGQQGRG